MRAWGGVMSWGSWLCENAKTLNRDRRSYSPKTALVAQGASGLNLEVGLGNIILRCVSICELLHGQGQKAKFRVDPRTSAWASKPDLPLLMARTDDVMPAAGGVPARTRATSLILCIDDLSVI